MDLEGLVRLGVIGLRAWLENLKQVAVAVGSVLKALQNLSSRRKQRKTERMMKCVFWVLRCVFVLFLGGGGEVKCSVHSFITGCSYSCCGGPCEVVGSMEF